MTGSLPPLELLAQGERRRKPRDKLRLGLCERCQVVPGDGRLVRDVDDFPVDFFADQTCQ